MTDLMTSDRKQPRAGVGRIVVGRTIVGSSIVERATDDFLRHLRERNASVHTIKAYRGDLANFAAYAGSRGWKEIDHIARMPAALMMGPHFS